MIEEKATRRLFPAIVAMAVVVALLWFFLRVLHP
jgi:hypothetical protein